MARKPRIHYPGAIYHVILRGNGGQNIFFSVADRSRFYHLLREGVDRFGHRLHAFCLMTNHIHLAIQVGEIPLAKIVQNLSFRYTRYINHRKKRIGHLFQGRYKAILLDRDAYLLELIRYIHLNPVRAGIDKDPLNYRWSSHRGYLGQETIPWLTTNWLLSQFAGDEKMARQRYEAFVLDGIAEGYRKEFQAGNFEGRILGDDHFAEKALLRAEEKYARKFTEQQVVDVVCKAYGFSQEQLARKTRTRREAEARAVAALLVSENEALTLVTLGSILGRDISGLSKGAGRLRQRLSENNELMGQLIEIRRQLT
ncbi:MAG: transposase [Desulfobulbaceae bacterium]|nr:transposase [Desulfobulbaceae bacterium]